MRLLSFERQRRLINHFKLGADPEWIITRGGDRIDAASFGLRTASAFGADMNGRLLELRAYPSRWAVEVLAGIWDTLRWAAYCIPKQHSADHWLTGAYQHDDGLGGHVHFGRKIPLRKIEAAALDEVNHLLANLGVFDEYLWSRRRSRRGNAGQAYGADGDTRPQIHGYEYRSFPSWLSSPEQAYTVLVLSKLAVQNPVKLLERKNNKHFQTLDDLCNFIGLYKHRDDDALLLDMVIKRGFSVVADSERDFLPQWGINPRRWDRPVPKLPTLFPSVIAPSATSIRGMYDYLLHLSPLAEGIPEVTWERTDLPTGYVLPLPKHSTVRQYGVGEILEGVCTHQDVQVYLHPVEGHSLTISPWYWFQAPKEIRDHWKAAFEEEKLRFSFLPEKTFGKVVNLNVGLHLRKHNPKLVTDFLTSGIFPVWKAFAVEPNTAAQWHKEHPVKFKNLRLKSGGIS